MISWSIDSPIGVFDSGLGGLTVARALRRAMPAENLVYFGDTARVPYGSKSAPTVHRFARECLRFLLQFHPKLLVVACNTVSALALEQLRQEFDVPVIGVLEPGAAAAARACTASRDGATPVRRVGLIATEATIASNAYSLAMRRINPALHVIGRACPLLVPMIEEGRDADDPIVKAVLREYLSPFADLDISALVLGCTHYPIFRVAIGRIVGSAVPLIDSAEETALAVEQELAKMAHPGEGDWPLKQTGAGSLTCYVTDQGQRFARLAGLFLGQGVGQPIWVTPEMLEAVSL